MSSGDPQIDGQMTDSTTGWRISDRTGSAADFHRRDPRATPQSSGSSRFEHEVWVHRLERPAIVLGSGQRTPRFVDLGQEYRPGDDDGDIKVDTEVELCRRRSGGGIVYIDPETDVWIDLIVPSWSPLWDQDVGRSFYWLGELWARLLRRLVASSTDLEQPVFTVARPSRSPGRSERGFFCFADVGHGEVLIDSAKVVGVSQRRTKDWTRLQSLLVTRWTPFNVERALEATLALSVDQQLDLGAAPYDAASVKAGLPDSIDLPPHDDVVSSFVAALPDLPDH